MVLADGTDEAGGGAEAGGARGVWRWETREGTSKGDEDPGGLLRGEGGEFEV